MNDPSRSVSRRTALQRLTAALVAGTISGRIDPAWAEMRHGPGGALSRDRRLGPLKDLNGYFPFAVPDSVAEWEERASYLRRQLRVALGLWPEQSRPPVSAVVHGRIDRPEYTVEKVYFESFSGLYVTGNLYRPKGFDGPRPVVLSPHGHWSGGRFQDHGVEGVREEIAAGAEQFEVGGRHPQQARCVQLARMGCIAFHYGMLGYADNLTLGYELVHRFAEMREDLIAPDRWGLFSAQAELRAINPAGLQTLNSLRVLDWVTTLPDSDSERIGITGESGGGTQTFLLAAIDPRVAASFPAVMVSTAMQGGCTCENASLLRVATGNVEIAGLVAPRPLGMTAANDWTVELESKGLPELKQLYALLGAPENVEGKHFDFPHNYNAVGRQMMYGFFNRHFGLGFDTPIRERDYLPLSIEEMTVWNDLHPEPPTGIAAELALMRAIDRDARRQLETLRPRDEASLEEYRRVVGGAVGAMIGRELPAPHEVELAERSEKRIRGAREVTGWLRYLPAGEELPVVLLLPDSHDGPTVIWLDERGKAGLFGRDGTPRGEVRRLLDAGAAVAGLDLLYQGDFLPEGEVLRQTRIVDNPREFAGYTLGYNHSLFAQRVHDVLTMIAFVQGESAGPGGVQLAGLGAAGAWAAIAAAVAGDALDGVAVDTGGFRFATITDVRDPGLLPGVVRYGDLPAMLSLIAPRSLWLGGEGAEGTELVRAAYAAEGAADRVTLSARGGAAAAAEWLRERPGRPGRR